MDFIKYVKPVLVGILAFFSFHASADDYTNQSDSENSSTTNQPVNNSQQQMNNNTTQPANMTGSQVNGNAQSDAQLLTSLQTALSSYKNKVNVSVTNGVVTLSGQLNSDTDYEKVVMLTESVKGVRDINADNLTVKDSSQPLKDSYITAKIKGTLIKEDIMGSDVSGWTIGVETNNGQVYLSGNVDNQGQKDKILKIVESIDGVNKVNDQMTIKLQDNMSN